MNKQLFSTLLFLFCSFLSIAAETVIQGKIEGFDQKIIKVGRYKDYITFEKEWITSVVIEDNSFRVTFPIEETTQILVKVEDKSTSFFAEAGKVYNLALSYDEEANRGQSFDKYLNLNFSFPKASETNQLIKKFNKAYEDFFAANYAKMMYKGATKETQEFIKKWENYSGFENNNFVLNYVKYSLANLEDVGGGSKEKLEQKFILEQPILYHQKEYMNFFTQFYQESFEQLTLKKESREMLKAIMFEDNLQTSLNELKKLKNFKRDELAELYLLNGLFEVYHKKVINQENSRNFLKQIQEKGKTNENRVIATNMLETFERFSRANNAVEFTLVDTDSKEHKLSDFRGKPVYLNFWSTASIPSLRELKVMQVLHEKYGKKIHFISINLDDDKTINQSIQSKNNYSWTFLHFGNDYDLKEKYQVTTIPTYFLIDENGGIIKAFAEGPVEVEKRLYNLVK